MQRLDDTAVQNVLNLQPGEAFSRSVFIPVHQTETDKVLAARKRLRGYLSPVVARAKEYSEQDYTIYTTVSHTQNYDTVVTGIVVLLGDDVDEIEI